MRRLTLLAALYVLAGPVPAAAATGGALSRYHDSAGHWVTTGPVSGGYALEGILGFLAPSQVGGTAPVYGCQQGTDHFLSLSSSCGGQTVLRTEGYIYTAPPAGVASRAVYLCVSETTTSEDHFAASDPGCEGHTMIGRLGYAPLSAALNRYNGGPHWVTAGSLPPGYRLEGTLGYLVAAGSNLNTLYGCIENSSDQFLSLDPNCEGHSVLGVEGYVYASPPSGLASSVVYRCRTASDHFASLDPHCEGQPVDGPLGFVLNGSLPPPPAAAAAPPPSVTTTLPVPPPSRQLRPLRVRIAISWAWGPRFTKLVDMRVGRMPRRAQLRITCRGHGPSCRPRALIASRRDIGRLIRALRGRIFHGGDRIYVRVSAPGRTTERAVIRIRAGRLPSVRR